SPTDPASPTQQRILDEIKQVEWYHSIPLSEGIVTPGAYDHRPLVKHYPIPEQLQGMRVLDAGTLDGFWAFEMERRGAREVVALDVATIAELDLPPRARQQISAEILSKRTGAGFEIARRLKNSRVERVALNLYDLSPERLGQFDFVLCSDLLCLLSDPVSALQNLRRVTRGEAVFMDRFNPFLPKYQMLYHGADEGCLWWSYSLTALEKMIGDAGFSDVQVTSTFRCAERGKRAWSSAATFRARG
ncbi:MAG: class I SAM-dependent methyltransferase, partial [Planctomycetales bacterium]